MNKYNVKVSSVGFNSNMGRYEILVQKHPKDSQYMFLSKEEPTVRVGEDLILHTSVDEKGAAVWELFKDGHKILGA